MKNTFTQRIVLGLLALFLLLYVGYQVYMYTAGDYKTETAYTYRVSEKTRITGIALRNEVIIEKPVNGVATYVAVDGTKLSENSMIAEVYRSEEDVTNIRKLREIQNRRALLEKAQEPGAVSYAHTDVLNKQIFGELGSIVDEVNSGLLTQVPDVSDKLLVLMNRKQIAMNQQTDFNDAIEQLNAQEKFYREQISADPGRIDSPRPGYFIREIDGFEGKVDISKLNELCADDIVSLFNTPEPVPSKMVGKLMTDHYWYFAAVVPNDEIEQYRLGASVTLDFHINGSAPVSAVISNVNTVPEDPNSVVVFKCDYINEDLVNLRIAQVDVNFKSVSGLRVSSSAIRFEGTQKGVYIILGDKLVFRPVTVLYEDVGFVLCAENDPAYMSGTVYMGLQQFDEVVIEGAQLYNDKPIKL